MNVGKLRIAATSALQSAAGAVGLQGQQLVANLAGEFLDALCVCVETAPIHERSQRLLTFLAGRLTGTSMAKPGETAEALLQRALTEVVSQSIAKSLPQMVTAAMAQIDTTVSQSLRSVDPTLPTAQWTGGSQQPGQQMMQWGIQQPTTAYGSTATTQQQQQTLGMQQYGMPAAAAPADPSADPRRWAEMQQQQAQQQQQFGQQYGAYGGAAAAPSAAAPAIGGAYGTRQPSLYGQAPTAPAAGSIMPAYGAPPTQQQPMPYGSSGATLGQAISAAPNGSGSRFGPPPSASSSSSSHGANTLGSVLGSSTSQQYIMPYGAAAVPVALAVQPSGYASAVSAYGSSSDDRGRRTSGGRGGRDRSRSRSRERGGDRGGRSASAAAGGGRSGAPRPIYRPADVIAAWRADTEWTWAGRVLHVVESGDMAPLTSPGDEQEAREAWTILALARLTVFASIYDAAMRVTRTKGKAPYTPPRVPVRPESLDEARTVLRHVTSEDYVMSYVLWLSCLGDMEGSSRHRMEEAGADERAIEAESRQHRRSVRVDEVHTLRRRAGFLDFIVSSKLCEVMYEREGMAVIKGMCLACEGMQLGIEGKATTVKNPAAVIVSWIHKVEPKAADPDFPPSQEVRDNVRANMANVVMRCT